MRDIELGFFSSLGKDLGRGWILKYEGVFIRWIMGKDILGKSISKGLKVGKKIWCVLGILRIFLSLEY